MRFTIFILVLLAIDIYSFQAVRLLAQDWSLWPKIMSMDYSGRSQPLRCFTFWHIPGVGPMAGAKTWNLLPNLCVHHLYFQVFDRSSLLIDDLRRLFTFAVQKLKWGNQFRSSVVPSF